MKRHRWSDLWVIGVAALLTAIFYFRTAVDLPGGAFSRAPQGYYGLQTAGFRAGHLYAAIEPKEGLLALANPYDPVANAPYRVHDMSLYRGHYYIYFGVTPIVIWFWPCAALTGWYPTEQLTVALFSIGAVWCGLGLVLTIRRRYFSGAHSAVLALAAAVLFLANPLARLLQGPQFYQVAISAAVFLQMAMLVSLYAALHGRRPMIWLAAAGLCFGLAVGARPNHLAIGPALIVAAALIASRQPPGRRFVRLLVLITAAAAPAAVCGAGLMAYNWLRFHSVAEFGVKYALSGQLQPTIRLFQGRFIPESLHTYLFNPGYWSEYFPFFDSPSGQPYGLLRYNLWAWAAPLALLPWFAPRAGRDGARRFAWVVATAVLGNLLLLSSFLGTNERYSSDFACAGLLLGGMGALALSDAGTGRPWRRWGDLLLGWLGCASLFTAVAVFIAHMPPDASMLAVGRIANEPEYLWRRLRHGDTGGLRLILAAGRQRRSDVADPVFETGRAPGQRDWLQLDYLPGGRARVAFFHMGMPGLIGDPFPIPPDGQLVIEAQCGALLPPFEDPAYCGWTREDYDGLKRALRVSVNGRSVLTAVVECYGASASSLTVGALAWPVGGVARKFSGAVIGVQRLPLRRPAEAPLRWRIAQPVQLSLLLPSQHEPGGDPILVTGQGTKSDLLYVFFDGTGRIKFGLDHFGDVGPQTEFIPFEPVGVHHLTLWMGSLLPSDAEGNSGSSDGPELPVPWSHRLVVKFDDRTLLNLEQRFFPSDRGMAVIGHNPYGATTAGPVFRGAVVQAGPIEFSALPALHETGAYGPVHLTVKFPPAFGTQEPLVVTGIEGAGDLIYIRYVDRHHVRVGFDHWGVGGFLGPLIALDYAESHRIALTMGSLYPAETDWGSARPIRVLIDGRIALDGRADFYPSTTRQIRIGTNPIGGSTCGPAFTGRILAVERTGDLDQAPSKKAGHARQ